MRCDNCGRMIQNEEANFCEYCGSSFREQRQAPFHIAPNEQEFQRDNRMLYPNMSSVAPNQTPTPNQNFTPSVEGQEKRDSFLGWLGIYGLLFIPFAGWLIFIIIVFLWAFGGNASVTKKNWARATLVFVGVLVVLFIIFTVIMLFTYGPMYQEMYRMIENGTFDNNSYLELIEKYY